MSDDLHEGGCLCGAVRFRARGEPSSTNLCFCSQCRRQTGAVMPAFATWPAGRVEIVKGEPAVVHASERAERRFCRDCGSPLFWQAIGAADIDVFLGSLDEPERIRPPEDQIWTGRRLSWVPRLPDTPDYPENRDDEV